MRSNPILPHVAAVQSVAQLSALTRLEVTTHYNHGDRSLSCTELACLRSKSLQDVTVSLYEVLKGRAALLRKAWAMAMFTG